MSSCARRRAASPTRWCVRRPRRSTATSNFPDDIFSEMAEARPVRHHRAGGAGRRRASTLLPMRSSWRSCRAAMPPSPTSAGWCELIATLLVAARHGRAARSATSAAARRCARSRLLPDRGRRPGSDLADIKTTATQTDGWLALTAAKLWIHNAPVADFALRAGAHRPTAAGHRGMSIFIVDLDAPGVTRGPKEHKMGQRASQVGGLNFDDVALPPGRAARRRGTAASTS